MPRPTRLKILGDRPIPEDVLGDPDPRSVDEAFPRQPDQNAGQLAQDVLEIIRRSQGQLEAETKQATAIATEALTRADRVVAGVAELATKAAGFEARASQVEKNTAAFSENVLNTIAHRDEANRVLAAARVAQSVGMLQKLASFIFDRAPAILALAAAIWLWRSILDNPTWLQLAALTLFGASVIAPAVWLSSRRSS